MHITINAGGRLKADAPEAIICNTYLTRSQPLLRRAGRLSLTLTESDRLPNPPPATQIIACDERGELLTTPQFADLLRIEAPLLLAIGPADGFTDAERRRCTKLIAFGRMTMPHLLLRAVLCEQIYRALSLLTGHPYHRF